MGVTYTTVAITDLGKKSAPYSAEFLVDTGAIDCMAPAAALVALGIEPEGEAVYELANGEEVKFDYGFARVSVLGGETVAQVVFCPENAGPILGVVALENLGLVVDPISPTLKRLHAKPMK